MSMPVLKLRQVVGFPGNIVGGTGINATKESGIVTVDLDWSEFGKLSSTPTSSTNYVLTFDAITGIYALVPSVLFGGIIGANLAINGDFRINQTGYISATTLSAGTYGHDQWKAGASGGDYSFTQLKTSTQITIAAGKSLIQPIEDVYVAGGSYVLSWIGTAQARAGVNTLTPSGTYVVSPLLITGQTAGTAMSIEFNAGTLGQVKLEGGAKASPFIMRPYDQELVTCKRYFCAFDKTTAVDAPFFGYSINSTQAFIWTPFPIEMRAVPTLGFNITTWGIVNNVNTTVPVTAASINTSSNKSAMLLFTTAGSLGSGAPCRLQTTSYPSASFYFDARL